MCCVVGEPSLWSCSWFHEEYARRQRLAGRCYVYMGINQNIDGLRCVPDVDICSHPAMFPR